MSPTIKVFATGLSGYIGGTAIVHLLEQFPEAKTKFSFRALVRSQEKAKTVEPLGITPVIGSLDDVDLIRHEARLADVVLNYASSDHVSSMQAIVQGLQDDNPDRVLARPVFIHTSGTGVLADDAQGNFLSEKIYSDDKPEEIVGLPDDAFHRHVELYVLDPKLHEKVDAYIVSPPLVWGRGSGLGNQNSIQLPYQITNALRQRRVYRYGKGLNRWNKIHVLDLAEFYALFLFKTVEQPNNLPKGRQGFWFCEAGGDFGYGETAKVIADELYKLGLADDDKVHETPEHKYAEVWPMGLSGYLLGSNSRSHSVLAGKYLGWKPKHGVDDKQDGGISKEFEEYLRYEVRRQVEKPNDLSYLVYLQ